MSIRDRLRQSVVAIRDDQGNTLGSGFFVGWDGTILTCFHLLGDVNSGRLFAEGWQVVFNEQTYPAERRYLSPRPQTLDVAILRLSGETLPPGANLLPLGRWEAVDGPPAFQTFGYRPPDALAGLFAAGEIRGRINTQDGAPLLQLASEPSGGQQIRQGMSGAPVYHQHSGLVVGMIVGFYDLAAEKIPAAVPLDEIAALWLPLEERLREEQLLQQSRDLFEIGRWFTETTFKAFYESLPIPNLIDYERLGDDKALALIEQLRGHNRAYDLINYLRIRRPDIPLTERVDLPPVHRINFVNRTEELSGACGRYAPAYLLFEAPAGYGKTELLKAIERRHFRDGWLSIYVELSAGGETVTGLAGQIARYVGYTGNLGGLPDVQAIGYVLGGALAKQLDIRNAPGLLLLIDSVEQLAPEAEIDAFLNRFLIALRAGLSGNGFRVRLAGRHIGPLWRRLADQIELAIEPLTPFRFRYVRDTAAILAPTRDDLDLWAAHVLHSTGGHPGCMAALLEGMDFQQPVEAFFSGPDRAWQASVLALADDIRASIPEDLRMAFDVLSIFRRYNFRLLTDIIAAGLFPYPGGAERLERALTATYLVRRRDGFIQDEIVRRLLALRLRRRAPERFLQLAQAAGDIYRRHLQESISRPEFIAIEYLYQHLQWTYYQGGQTPAERRALRRSFFDQEGVLAATLARLAAKEDAPDIKANLITRLGDQAADWEFRFAVNFFLRGDTYDNSPYTELLGSIDPFFSPPENDRD